MSKHLTNNLPFAYTIADKDVRYFKLDFAKVAQLVEQRTENPCVVGSIPTLGTIFQPLLTAMSAGAFCLQFLVVNHE